ncbi:MAG: chorismate mutase [archaeon]|nr:chorismate mutase [archaeon]
MDSNKKMELFKNKDDAQKLLEESRKRIDEIDNNLVDLIHERTSLAKNIVTAKVFLGMEIYDENREKIIHAKINKLANEKDIDADILGEIMNMLTILSKNKQKDILEE